MAAQKHIPRRDRPKNKRGRPAVRAAWQTDTPHNPFSFLGVQNAWHAILKLTEDAMGGAGGEGQSMETLPLDRPVKMAVLDSGINKDHQAFRHGNIKEVKEFVTSTNDSHGTQVAAFAAGGHFCPLVPKKLLEKEEYLLRCLGLFEGGDYENDGELYSAQREFSCGLAPFCELYIGVVVGAEQGNTGSIELIAKAIQWAVEKKVDIINISMGTSFLDTGLQQAVLEALNKGVIVVASASNDGRHFQNTVEYPGRLGNVITVGSHDSYGEKSRFSAVGRELGFLAPGEGILSACGSPASPPPSGPVSWADQSQALAESEEGWSLRERGVALTKGTSLSTPFVAGLCALVLAFAEKVGKKLGDGDLRERVSNTWVMKRLLLQMSRTPGHHDQVQGHGSLLPSRIFDLDPRTFQRLVSKVINSAEMDASAARGHVTDAAVQMPTNENARLELCKLIVRELDHYRDFVPVIDPSTGKPDPRLTCLELATPESPTPPAADVPETDKRVLDFVSNLPWCHHVFSPTPYLISTMFRDLTEKQADDKPFLLVMSPDFSKEISDCSRTVVQNTDCFILTSQWTVPALDTFLYETKKIKEGPIHVHVEKLVVKDMDSSRLKLTTEGCDVFYDSVDDEGVLQDFLTRSEGTNVLPLSACNKNCLQTLEAKPYFSLQEYLHSKNTGRKVVSQTPPAGVKCNVFADVAVQLVQAVTFLPRLQVVDLRDEFSKEPPVKYPGADIVQLFDELCSRGLTTEVLYLPDNLSDFDHLEEILSHPFLGTCDEIRLQGLSTEDLFAKRRLSLRDTADVLCQISKSNFQGVFEVDCINFFDFQRTTVINEQLSLTDLQFRLVLTNTRGTQWIHFHDADGSMNTVLAIMQKTSVWTCIWQQLRKMLEKHKNFYERCGSCHLTVYRLKSLARDEILHLPAMPAENAGTDVRGAGPNAEGQGDINIRASDPSQKTLTSVMAKWRTKDKLPDTKTSNSELTENPAMSTPQPKAKVSPSLQDGPVDARGCPPRAGHPPEAEAQARPLHVVFVGYGFPVARSEPSSWHGRTLYLGNEETPINLYYNETYLRDQLAREDPWLVQVNGRLLDSLDRAGVKAVHSFLQGEDALFLEDDRGSYKDATAVYTTRMLTKYMMMACTQRSALEAGKDVCFSSLQVVPTRPLQKEGQAQGSWEASTDAVLAAVSWLLDVEREKPGFKADVVVFPRGVAAFSRDLYQTLNRLSGPGRVLIASAHLDCRGHLTMPACLGDVICVAGESFKGKSSCVDFSAASLGQEALSQIVTGETTRLRSLAEAPPKIVTQDTDRLRNSEKFLSNFIRSEIARFRGAAEKTLPQRLLPVLLDDPEVRRAVEVAAVAGVAVRLISLARALDGEMELEGLYEKAMCNTEMMRRVMQDMCDNFGEHSETRGYGELEPGTFLDRGQTYLSNFLCRISPSLKVKVKVKVDDSDNDDFVNDDDDDDDNDDDDDHNGDENADVDKNDDAIDDDTARK